MCVYMCVSTSMIYDDDDYFLIYIVRTNEGL